MGANQTNNPQTRGRAQTNIRYIHANGLLLRVTFGPPTDKSNWRPKWSPWAVFLRLLFCANHRWLVTPSQGSQHDIFLFLEFGKNPNQFRYIFYKRELIEDLLQSPLASASCVLEWQRIISRNREASQKLKMGRTASPASETKRHFSCVPVSWNS